jgi:1-acyl-sn-glycerol-3-phosphate acyltransferase
MGTIPVRAEGQDSRAIRTALRTLASGGMLAIFPEGTRSPDGRMIDPRPGAALIATMSGAPVIPAFIDGARRSMPVGGRFPKPARIHVRFGPPLTCPPAAGRDRESIAAFSAALHEAIRRLEPAA